MKDFSKVYIASIDSLYNEEVYKKHYEKANDYRKQKADKLVKMQDRARSIGVWSLFRFAVEQETEYDFDSFVFETDANGKPYIKDSKLFFSLSHSGDYVACAISNKPIGVDIEFDRQLSEGFKQRYAENISEWTKKEAWGKLTGKGVLNNTFDNSNKACFCFTEKKDGYYITACTKTADCKFVVADIF